MSDSNTPKTSFVKGIKSEFSKIVFPKKEDVARETVSVIVIGVLLGAVIAVLDLIMKTGLGFIIK